MQAILFEPRKIEGDQDTRDLAKIATGLGLKVQARRYAANRSIERDFTALTGDEWLVVRFFAPTCYTQKGSSVPTEGRVLVRLEHRDRYEYYYESSKPIGAYAFDTIPPEVLRHWETIKRAYAFDEIMVRTTEKTVHKDPILVGLLGGAAYLLARWGDESPGELPTTKSIAKRVADDLEIRLSMSKGVFGEPKYWYRLNPVWQAAQRVIAA